MASMGMGRGRTNIGKPTEKPKNFKVTLKRLSTYISKYKFGLTMVVILTVLSNIFTVVSPKIMGMVTTKLLEGMKLKSNGTGGIDFVYIRNILFFLGILYIFSAIFSYLQRFLMTGITQKVVYTLRKDVDAKLARLPLKYYDENQVGDILSRVTNDVDNISSTLQQTITQLITSLVTVIGILVMMLSINIPMSLIIVLVIPLSVFATRKIAKKSQGYFKDQSHSLGNLNGHIEEMYSGQNIVKAFSMEEKSIEDFDNINGDLYKSSYKAQFISGLIRPIMNLINNLAYILVAVLGGFLVVANKISIGDVQAFIQYSREFTQPVVRGADIINTIQATIASAERVFQVLDEVEETEDSDLELDIDKVKGQVEFRNVNFSYNEDETLIEDMNIKVNPGETVAIVGPTGAGKTTLVNLLMRFYDLDSGQILIDGVDIHSVTRKSVRRVFGMVLQDTWLFKGSIKDNIGYGKDNSSLEEIKEVAKIAQSDFFISTLGEGYETVLEEDADNISQGQKQLLTIARAIIADPAIMILDEATSSVDTRTENLIQKAMDKIMEGRTSFVIAHRLSTIKNADVILVMNEGRVIEQGNHKELMKEQGFYYELYNSQFAV